MTTGIYRVTNPLADSIADLFKNGAQTVGDLGSRAVRFIQTLPSQMHQDHNVAIAVFASTNAAFFALNNLVANWLNNRIEKHPEELNDEQRTWKNILVNGVVVGSSTLVFNVVLSKITDYPLSKATLAAITIAAIAARYFISGEAAPAEQDEVNGKKQANDEQKETAKKLADEAEALKKKQAAEAEALKKKQAAEAEEVEALKKKQAAEAKEAEASKKKQAAEAKEAEASKKKQTAEAKEAEASKKKQTAEAEDLQKKALEFLQVLKEKHVKQIEDLQQTQAVAIQNTQNGSGNEEIKKKAIQILNKQHALQLEKLKAKQAKEHEALKTKIGNID